MLSASRMAWKPEAISALTARAMARAARSSGQRRASGKSSAAYSQMARDSQTTRSPCRSAGTLPEGEWGSMSFVRCSPGLPRGMSTSSKGMPAWVRAIQGRMDQEE